MQGTSSFSASSSVQRNLWPILREHDKAIKTPPRRDDHQTNPEYDKWVEHAALILCLDAGECGVIPTPCSPHLSEARRFAMDCRTTFNA